MRPPVQADVAVKETEGHPNSDLLTELTGTPAVCKARTASTIPFVVPFAPPTKPVAGTLEPNALPMKERMPSYPAKKKSLSFLIGPPTTPPNCSNCNGSLAQEAWPQF